MAKAGSMKMEINLRDQLKDPEFAPDFLASAVFEMQGREETYDEEGGERSIAKTVDMFNALTGHNLTEEQGWKFMICLKLVRSEKGDFKADSFIDGAAYFALAGESANMKCKT